MKLLSDLSVADLRRVIALTGNDPQHDNANINRGSYQRKK
jgi:hypothetical protein